MIAKLGLKAAKATGDFPQNANYAVKSAVCPYPIGFLPRRQHRGAQPAHPEAKFRGHGFKNPAISRADPVLLILRCRVQA